MIPRAFATPKGLRPRRRVKPEGVLFWENRFALFRIMRFNRARNYGLWLCVPAFAGTTAECGSRDVARGDARFHADTGPTAAKDFPVSAASTRRTMWSRRSSLAFFASRSRPKITLSVALFER